MRIESAVRVGMAAVGALIALVLRRRVAARVARAPWGGLPFVLAAAVAIPASEPVLRRLHLDFAEWLRPAEEPLRKLDARLGWTLVPARTGRARSAGRLVEYAIDASGYRVRRVGDPVDPTRPTIVFIGESIMFGEGLTWEESVPAQVEAMTGVQGANLAVHGYATDQAYLRLEAELPSFRHPVAVVALFMPALFGRNLDHQRPHLEPGLVWRPAVPRWRLVSLAQQFVPYHDLDTIDEGIRVTRDVLRATSALARARGAASLIVVPQLGAESAPERTLRHLVLDASRVPYVMVQIDPAWHLPWDRHPNAYAAHVIASAIAARLAQR